MNAEILQIAEIINSLGENAKGAFIWYLAMSLGKTAIIAGGFIVVAALVVRRNIGMHRRRGSQAPIRGGRGEAVSLCSGKTGTQTDGRTARGMTLSLPVPESRSVVRPGPARERFNVSIKPTITTPYQIQ
jgi:hypothetical protein